MSDQLWLNYLARPRLLPHGNNGYSTVMLVSDIFGGTMAEWIRFQPKISEYIKI